MGLPSGYRKLQYIQSSGTQYINTAFNPNQDTRVVISFEPTQTKTWTGAFGARNATNDSEYGVDFPSGTEIRSVFGSETLSIAIPGMLARFDVDKNKNICTINGATITNAAQIFQTNYPIWIFDKNTAGAKWSPISMKLYSCQIYDNGTLVRDYIPCQTTSGEIGLWDDVNMLFYRNAGTGTFVGGPIKVNSLNLPVNIGGTWKDANEAFVNIGGTWKTVEAAFVNIGGTWKELS